MWQRAMKLSWYDFAIVGAVLLLVAHFFPHQHTTAITCERTFGWLCIIVTAGLLARHLFAKKPEDETDR